MSVDRTSYLLYGFKFEDTKEMKTINNHYDELMEGTIFSNLFNNSDSDQTIVFDGMCGFYIYVGLKIAKMDEDEEDLAVEIDESELFNLKDKLKEYMSSWPDYLVDLCKDKTPKLYFFVHAY